MARQERIRVEAASLEDARAQLRARIPEGMTLIDENVIADGKPQNLQGTGSTVHAAFEDALSRKPADSEVAERRVISQPKSEQPLIQAFDTDSAQRQAQSRVPRTATLAGVVLKAKGRRGFLGLGKTPDTYEAKIEHRAIVEVTVKNKAVLEGVIAPPIPDATQKEISEYYHACYRKAHDAARRRVLEDVLVYPGQNPYEVAQTALLREHDSMAQSARNDAQKKTASKYGITLRQIEAILGAGG
jgi:hypothetical protein